MKIRSWPQFARHIRAHGCTLLQRLDNFPRSILVTGCQRSGTTIVSRVISQSEGVCNFSFSRDDELDAALILSGHIDLENSGRYCFQTTYLNECYHEYYEHDNDYKIVWVIRNPYSVVYSLAYHWSRFALNELFAACGIEYLNETQAFRYSRFGNIGINRFNKACCSYIGKVSQLFELQKALGEERIMIIDYDELVQNKNNVLPRLYEFVDLPYKSEYGSKIHGKSVEKAKKLSEKQKNTIKRLCIPLYQRAKSLADIDIH